MKNPLFDQNFLMELFSNTQREIYSRITLLTNDELPLEYIEGRVTGGSINIDGNSALRRTCNLTMVLYNQKEINNFYLTFKRKFKLEIGLANNINNNYPKIIWFKQGLFILTSCNINHSANNYTITINGKDKMCLLNGDISGSIPEPVEFHVQNYVDRTTGKIIEEIPTLKTIIYKAVSHYGGELFQNIIINDLDTAGLELLEYRDDDEKNPLYAFRNEQDGLVSQITLNGDMQVIKIKTGNKITIKDSKNIIYATNINLLETNESNYPTQVKFDEKDNDIYTILKFEHNDLIGYRQTDLTYAGELINNVGESLTSVLDKIKNMLGNYEYFYNVDGKFVFQKKRNYVSTPWNQTESNVDDYVSPLITDGSAAINLINGQLITSFGNNPNLLNVKNDFSAWGTAKSPSGTDMPIHMRYAIHKKPTKYSTIRSIPIIKQGAEEESLEYKYYDSCGAIKKADNNDNQFFISKPFTTTQEKDCIQTNWREIIYQMAKDWQQHNQDDDFLLEVAAKNPQYPTGKTGYEQYYVDFLSFWRDIYDPNPGEELIEISSQNVTENSFITDYFSPLTENEREKILSYYSGKEEELLFSPEDIYVSQEIKIKDLEGKEKTCNTFYPFIGSEECRLWTNDDGSSKIYYYQSSTGMKASGNIQTLNSMSLNSLYVLYDVNNEKYEPLIQRRYKKALNDGIALYVRRLGEHKPINQLTDYEKAIYMRNSGSYLSYLSNWSIVDNYGNLSSSSEEYIDLRYSDKIPNPDFQDDGWNTIVKNNPEALSFWIDFLDTTNDELAKYSIESIGSRTKAVNDTNIKSMYYKDVPNTIFVTNHSDTKYPPQPGYTYIQVPSSYNSLFNISTKGKSAKEKIDELLYNHSFCIENVNISAIPLYNLEPNVKIQMRDAVNNISGEYLVTKITLPLTYNGTMTLTANKIASSIL